ncbi:MAG: DUF308 domain-containing protein [archaeon]|nr:DUF308 domain-containing protein [archaeon]
MEESNKLVKGISLIAIGAAIIYMSVAFRLIDLILFLGVIIFVIGVIYLILAAIILFYDGTLASTAKNITNFVDSKSKGSKLKSNRNPRNSRNSNIASNIKNANLGFNIKNSVLDSSGLNHKESSSILQSYGGRNNNQKSSASFLGPSRNKESNRADNSNSYYSRNNNANSNNYMKERSSSILNNLRSKDSKSNSKAVLRTRPEYNDSFANVSDYDEYQESFEKSDYVDYEEYQKESNDFYQESKLDEHDYDSENDGFNEESYDYLNNNYVPPLRELNFTPNYEKPMRITRKPRRKSPEKIDVHNVPKRSSDGSRLILNDNTYLEFEKDPMIKAVPHRKTYDELAREVIVPIHESSEEYVSPVQEDSHLVDVYTDFKSDDEYLPYDKEFVIDDLDDDLDEDISVIAPIAPIKTENLPQPKFKDINSESAIKVDPNNPESLPIPRLLNSYVICENKGILTSKDAFEEVATHAKSEILLEAPDIREMGEVFLLALTKVNSRVIIPELDTSDLSYVLLISSLVKSGIQVRTLPSVDSFNLIGDLSHALIISNNPEDDFEYGAVYDDEDSVRGIKELFESSWDIAEELDLNQ